MGILSWVFGGGSRGALRLDGWHLDGIKLDSSVVTPLGGRVKCLGCVVDIDYRLRGSDIDVVGVRLSTSSLNGAAFNVIASRRGEAWLADGALRKFLERNVLPRAVRALVQEDDRLRRTLFGKPAAGALATDKQKGYARKLGIRFSPDISKSELSDLIDAKLAEKR